jgi:hypothetical protein
MAGKRKTRGFSIRITKILKIRAAFFELCDRCQAAHEGTDFKEKIRTKREFYEYTSKHRKVLRVSEEMVNGLKASLIALEKSDAEVDRAEARLAKAKREAEKSRQEYYQVLLEEPPTGKKRIEH